MSYLYKYKYNFKVWFLIIVNLIIIFSFTSCSAGNISETNKSDQYGNLMSNIVNNGLASEQKEWVYCTLDDGFYKLKIDGSGKEKLSDDLVSYVNVWRDWIYYSNDYPGNGEIYKIATDGSGKRKLNNERSENLIINDDWIYYSTIKYCEDDEIEFSVKKIRIDGTDETIVVYEHIKNNEINPSGYFYLYDGWIYYKSMMDMNKFYKVKIDGLDKVKVSDKVVSSNYTNSVFNVNEGWIYYIQPNDDNKLYRMKIDGTEGELVINKSIADINITNDYIFYTDSSENYTLFRRSKNSVDEKKLADYSVSDINLIGNWIYCRNVHSELEFYEISCDGSSSKELVN